MGLESTPNSFLEPVHNLYSGVGFSRYFCASAPHVPLSTIRCGSRKTAKILCHSEIMNRLYDPGYAKKPHKFGFFFSGDTG